MGFRRMMGQALRKLSAQMLPLIAYFSLVFGKTRRASSDPGQVIEVRDRRSDVTVVSFAGIAALHGGMVNFEFTELLRRLAWEPNLVFVRDPLCACYHLRPDGTPGGLDYYAEHVKAAVAATNPKHVVFVGTSIGGMAALHFGTRLGADQVIAFSPTWPPERYLLKYDLAAVWDRIKLAARKPKVFVERVLLAQMARVTLLRLCRVIGRKNLLDLEGELARAATLPRITVLHGAGCEPDVATARAIGALPGTEIVVLPTAMHNSSGYLKSTGQLVPTILERVEAMLRERGIARPVTLPPPATKQLDAVPRAVAS